MGGSKHNMHQVNNTTRCKKKIANMKVVYISSPLMVTTSASEFRALVQELTGRHSDISQLLEHNYGNHHVSDQPVVSAELDLHGGSPTNSESLVEPSDDVFVREGILDLLRSDLVFDDSELDVLGTYNYIH